MGKKKAGKGPGKVPAPEVGKRERKRGYTLSFSPALYSDLRKIAYVQRTTVSQILTGMMEDFRQRNQVALEEYERITGKLK